MDNKKYFAIGFIVFCYLGYNLSTWIMGCETEQCHQQAFLISFGVAIVCGMVYGALVRWEYYEKVIKPI
jgi:hypothetical protein